MKNQINDSRKEIILHTARDLLIKNGFAKTTLDDIANAIGMKKSSLYYYYSNKDSLFDDIMMREEKYFCSLVAEALKKSETAIDKIISYEKAKFEYVKDTLKLHEMSTSIILKLKIKMFDHIKSIQGKEIEMIKKILDEGIMNKEIKMCDTKKLQRLS
ncbi:TetR/AcrR family transcriptional regulator [Ignavibacterium sp.]|jgi:AcrR family transcriptional regulator|uniref:TetR/AcrR family transcriptional regulator n=1 Tax=Ignavibacterium sp. TaxID=2651167 RepID=UPI0025C4F6C0|nr:TetR/AcrR family transcriptional regulator [Ignavibacterium sp.]